MSKAKIKLLKFKVRLIACYRILFGKYEHFFIVNLSENDLMGIKMRI